MNCQSCNTTIDYRFLTNCPHCETEQTDLLPLAPVVDLHTVEAVENRLTWTRRLINLAYLVTIAMAGLCLGAVVIYCGTAVTFIAVLTPLGVPSPGCGTGHMIGLLAIFTGAFLGTIGGSVFAVKNPVCKAASG